MHILLCRYELYTFVFCQKYVLLKKTHPLWTDDRPWPVDLNYMLEDTIETLRAKFHLVNTFEEACGAVEELEREYR